MKRFSLVLALIFCLNYAKPARAESTLPTEFNNIFGILESMILSGNGLPGSIVLGGCTPLIIPGFPSTTLKFTSSIACPFSGDVRLNLIPFGANVRLEVMNNPFITALDLDIVMSLKTKAKVTTFAYTLTNGHISFRLNPSQPLQDWMLSGSGTRVTTKTSLKGSSRVNIFDKATGNGRAIVKTVAQVKPAAKVKTSQACALAGAEANNVLSGTLSGCVDNK